MNIVLIGPPGAGKSTQARRLQDAYGLKLLSTGDMLREARANDTEIGYQIAAIMDRGDLVSDEIILKLMQDHLHKGAPNGFVCDGFPRTLVQAEALAEMLTRMGQGLDVVIALQVDEPALLPRITGRYACGTCGEVYHDINRATATPGRCDICDAEWLERRADDCAASLRARLQAYQAHKAAIAAFYRDQGLLQPVDGMAKPACVAGAITDVLDNS